MKTISLGSEQLAALYHRDYYLGDCEGHEAYRRSHGRKLTRRLAKCLALLDPRPGERIVDIGCGRGELSLQALARGARVLALDPSPGALGLVLEAADQGFAELGPPHRVRARGEALPIKSGWAEKILLSDVVEHLDAAALARLFSDCQRVLAPGGRLVIHTQPNRLLVDLTVPFLSRLSRLWGVRLPRDLRDEMTPGARGDYHPNEQSRRSLKQALLNSGFEIDELWLEGSYPVHRIFGEGRLKEAVLERFRRSRMLKDLLASQIFAVARKE